MALNLHRVSSRLELNRISIMRKLIKYDYLAPAGSSYKKEPEPIKQEVGKAYKIWGSKTNKIRRGHSQQNQ